MKVGILTSHPIQYQAPLFRALAKEMDMHVYFAHRATPKDQSDAGFGMEFNWDIDLLGGYKHTFLRNCSCQPRLDSFFGCDTPEIKQIIRAEKFDAFLVMGWNLKSYWQAVLACRHLRVPVLVRGDSNLSTPRSWPKKLAKELAWPIMLRQFDAFLVVGAKARQYLLHYGVHEKKMFNVPHFVDNKWFKASSLIARKDRGSFRIKICGDQNAIVVLFVGKFVPVKRPLDLICALALLRSERIKIQAIYIGAGQLESQIRAKAKELDVKLHILGFKNQSELPYYYSVSDLLVLCSSSETWGLVVNEAMACGLPAVLSTSVGCVPDLIEEGATGALYPVGNVEALADAIKKVIGFLDTPAMQDAINKKIKKYSVEAAVDGVRQAISMCISQKIINA